MSSERTGATANRSLWANKKLGKKAAPERGEKQCVPYALISSSSLVQQVLINIVAAAQAAI
jgi:hypothetical protein